MFDVWFDPDSRGGPWHDATKLFMNVAIDGMLYSSCEAKLNGLRWSRTENWVMGIKRERPTPCPSRRRLVTAVLLRLKPKRMRSISFRMFWGFFACAAK